MLTTYNPTKVGVLDDLRRDGYKVFVSHRRVLTGTVWEGEHVRDFKPDDKGIFVTRHDIKKYNYSWEEDISPTGGVTTVTIYDKDNNLLGEGISYCCLLDSFNKRTGLIKALGRAIGKSFYHK